jgi:hypothetical protein
MSGSKVQVGSVGYWAAMRFAQFFMTCMGLIFVLVGGRSFPLQLALILGLWFLFVAYVDSCIYGFADEDVVHFRRYISMQFIPWTKNRSRLLVRQKHSLVSSEGWELFAS